MHTDVRALLSRFAGKAKNILQHNTPIGTLGGGKTDTLFAIHPTWMLLIGVVALATLALAIKVSLMQHFPLNSDLQNYLLPWTEHLRTHGIAGLADNFSNYNMPYLYILYVISNLPIDPVIGIKTVSVFFDFVIAATVYAIVRHFHPRGFIATAAALFSLYAPTVMLNSAAWGQCDGIYTSFVLLCFLAAIKNKWVLSWALYGVAIAFKLNAIFFLPALVTIWLFYARKKRKNIHFLEPLVAIGTFCAGFILGIIAGKPMGDLFYFISGQVDFYKKLTMGATNLYQWLPHGNNDAYFNAFNKAGILLCAAVCIAFLLYALHRFAYRINAKQALFIASIIVLIVPFTLPQMHERYFYTAEIFMIIIAFVLQSKRVFLYAFIVSMTGFFSYLPFLVKWQAFPHSILALIQLCIIIAMLFELSQHKTLRKLATKERA